jgi:hypothetical protein
MKRWASLLGRGGTVLIAISLALLTISIIPPLQTGSFSATTPVGAKSFKISPLDMVMSPQRGWQVTVTANSTLDVYILEVSAQALGTSEPQQGPPSDYPVATLEEFLETNPDSIGRHEEISEGRITYSPTKVTNATLIFSNPGLHNIAVDYEGKILTFIAPATRLQNISLWITPIGFILAIPWLSSLWKQRKKPSS